VRPLVASISVRNKSGSVSTHLLLIRRLGLILTEILVYKGNCAAFFRNDFFLTFLVPVSHHSSRKQFFAKLFGLAAVAGLISKVSARPDAAARNSGGLSPRRSAIVIRPDARAVARRAELI
jgi:hypothetical protein